jgi:hypothetical protein
MEAEAINVYFINNGTDDVRYAPDTQVMIDLETKLSSRQSGADLNFLYTYLGNQASKKKDTKQTQYYYGQLNKEKINNSLRSSTFVRSAATFSELCLAVKNLGEQGKLNEAYSLVTILKNPINRASVYAFAAKELLLQKNNAPVVKQLMDSSRAELGRVENANNWQPNRALLGYALSLQDPDNNQEEAFALVKNFPDKMWSSVNTTRSFAFHGNLHQAKLGMIDNISDDDMAEFLWNMLFKYSQGKEEPAPEWREFTDNYLFFIKDHWFYLNEENF